MSLTKSAMDPVVRPLSSEEENARASEADCREALDAIVGLFSALDLLHLRAARAAGYGTPMYARIMEAWTDHERGFDRVRQPSEPQINLDCAGALAKMLRPMCRWGGCVAASTTMHGATPLCAVHAADADEIDREASIKPEMEAEDAF